MKVEICGALLHRPQVLFLDEPTIGLDVTMQKRIRSFVAEYNRRYGATVLLTSHYMADVQALCKRVIVIHHGRILFDGELSALADQFAADEDDRRDAQGGLAGPVRVRRGHRAREDGRTIACASRAPTRPRSRPGCCATCPVADLTIEDPPIEDVIETVFAPRPRRSARPRPPSRAEAERRETAAEAEPVADPAP